MNFYNKLCLAIAVMATGVMAQAATEPFYQLKVVNSNSDSGEYDFRVGPYAKSLGAGADPVVHSVKFKNDAFTYFNKAANNYDYGQYLHRYYPCEYTLDSDVCDGLWYGLDYPAMLGWRHDMLYHNPTVKTVITVGDTTKVTTEDDMIYMQVDSDGEQGVGYRMTDHIIVNYQEVVGIAKFNNKTFILKSPVLYDHENDKMQYATALSFIKISDTKYLVGGYSSAPGGFDEDNFYDCYQGDLGDDNDTYDFLACPAFNMLPTIWFIDTDVQANEAVITGKQTKEYVDADIDNDNLSTGAINSFVKLGDTYYGVGYSATNEFYVYYTRYAPVATYFPLAYDENNTSDPFSFTNNGFLFDDVETPGRGDEDNSYTWAQKANRFGYVALNRRLDSSVNSNYPYEVIISQIQEDGSSKNTSYPLTNKPIRGANSVAEDINDNNLVVGWRDDRNDISPVNGSVMRDSEGLFYDINTDTAYYINDMICHLDDNDAIDCSIDGKYYFIEHVVAINNDNVILASGYEYATRQDWEDLKNAKIVTLKLTPTAGSFIHESELNSSEATDQSTTYDKYIMNPQAKNRIVSYSREPYQYSSKSGGSFDFLSLGLLALIGCGLRRRTRSK